MIQQLNHNHFDTCLNMLLNQKKISGIPVTNTEKFEGDLKKYFDDDRYEIIGYFKSDELISWMIIGFYHHGDVGDFWIIVNVISKDKKNYFRFSRPDIKALIRYAFNRAESKKIYQYFYSVSEKIASAYEIQWYKDNPMNYDGVYQMFDVAIIPPNTRPSENLYWKIMNQETKPYAVYIKKRVKN